MLHIPKLMGIVNLTEDSFYVPNRHLNLEDAIHFARQLIKDGADILDLGPAASSPNAKAVDAETEIARIQPFIDLFRSSQVQLSIDSFLPQTQLFALQHHVHFINDIQGFPYPDFYGQLAAYPHTKLIMMHSIQRSGIADKRTSSINSLFDEITKFFDQRLADLTAAGIARERLILDPGMGFFLSNTPAASINILKCLSKLKANYHLPVLISVSRKSFLKNLVHCDSEQAGAATLAAELYAILFQQIDYVRTHDVRSLRDALIIMQQLIND